MMQSPIDLIPSMARTDPDIAIKLLNYDTVMAIKDPLEQSLDPDSLVQESETKPDLNTSLEDQTKLAEVIYILLRSRK